MHLVIDADVARCYIRSLEQLTERMTECSTHRILVIDEVCFGFLDFTSSLPYDFLVVALQQQYLLGYRFFCIFFSHCNKLFSFARHSLVPPVVTHSKYHVCDALGLCDVREPSILWRQYCNECSTLHLADSISSGPRLNGLARPHIP